MNTDFNFSEEELQQFIEQNMVGTEKAKSFFESKQFNKIFKKIKKYVTENNAVLSDEILLYDNDLQKKVCSAEDFCKVFESIEYNLEFETDNEAMFPTDHLEYKGLIFEIVVGQGTALVVSLPPYKSFKRNEIEN